MIYFAIILLSVNPVCTEGKDGINLLLCALLCISPLALLLKKTFIFVPRIDIPFGLVCFFIIFFPFVFHPDSVRWPTMLFTCAYCIFFMMFSRVAKNSDIIPAQLCRLIKYIVYAYFIVLVIQQICTFIGIPIPLKSMIYLNEYPYKLNSLSFEPSHTSLILSILMYFYSQTRMHEYRNKNFIKELVHNKWVWLAYCWILFTTVNISAYIFFPLSLLPFLNRRNAVYMAGILGILSVILIITPFKDSSGMKRLSAIVSSTATLDEEAIINSDLSAANRIVPTIRGFKSIDFTDISLLTGYGVDADKKDIAPRPDDSLKRGFAGIFSMWHNYGALCAISFWTGLLLVTVIRKKWITIITAALGIIISAEYNIQFIWLLMCISLIYKYSIYGDRKLLEA